jgi:hypothetical protein
MLRVQNSDLRLGRNREPVILEVTHHADDGDIGGIRIIIPGGDVQESRGSNVNPLADRVILSRKIAPSEFSADEGNRRSSGCAEHSNACRELLFPLFLLLPILTADPLLRLPRPPGFGMMDLTAWIGTDVDHMPGVSTFDNDGWHDMEALLLLGKEFAMTVPRGLPDDLDILTAAENPALPPDPQLDEICISCGFRATDAAKCAVTFPFQQVPSRQASC